MKPPRSVTRALPLALGVAVALSGGATAFAQNAQSPPFQGTNDENEAYRLYNENHPLTARTHADAALRANPNSIAGHFVLGCVLHEAEGSLAQAMYHLGESRRIYESTYGRERTANAPWRLHREILFAIQALAGEMEEYDYQYQMLEFYDYLYDPDLTAEHAWPLLHLGRYNDARDFARRAIASNDAWQQSLGRNGLCAIEGAARQRQASFTACLDAFQSAQRRAAGASDINPATAPHVAVHAYNAALAAQSMLRFDEVERLATEGTHRLEFTTANPWRILVRLYLDQGRSASAVNSLREMQRWRIRQPANLRDQDHAETDGAVATVLLAAGEAETGLMFVNRALERPDRRGLVASDPEQALGAHALLRRALERTQSELLAERASWSGTGRRVRGFFASLGERIQAWPDDERIANVLSDERRLDSTLRMYVRGGIEPVPVWLVGDLVQVLGAGVVSVALRDVRREERDNRMMTPYYDALEAEIALAQGDEERAVRLARSALERLPGTESMLQGRVAAVGAEAARRSGNEAVELGLFERAMQKDPGAVRRLGYSIPAVIRRAASGEAAERAETLLGRSPRFRSASRGFAISVEGGGNHLRVCMRSAMGSLLNCSDVSQNRNESQEDFGARAVEAFHRQAFAVQLGLSTTDMRSLDGSTSTDSQAAREQMNNVLRDLGADPDAQR